MKKVQLGVVALCVVIGLVLAGCQAGFVGAGDAAEVEGARYATAGAPVSSAFTAAINFSNKDKGTVTFVSAAGSFTAEWKKPFYGKQMDIDLSNLPAGVVLASSGHTFKTTSVGGAASTQALRVISNDFVGTIARVANIDPKAYRFDLSLNWYDTTGFTTTISFANKDKGTVTLKSGTESFTATWKKPFYGNRMDITFNLPGNLAAADPVYEAISTGGLPAVIKPLRIVNGNWGIVTGIDKRTWKFNLTIPCIAK